MPSLWTFFSVRSHIYWPVEVLNAGAGSFFNFVNDYFQRSGDLPKSVDVYLPFNYHDEEDDFPFDDGSLLGAIFAQDIKIKNLSFGTYDICHLLSQLGLGSSSRPSLLNPSILESVESLVLYSTGSHHGSHARLDPARTPFRPSHFKSLRRLSLEPGDSATIDVSFPIPWSNLTHLAINSYIPWRPWLTLFKKLTALQEGLFYVFCNQLRRDNDPTLETYKAQFPDLSNLTLIFESCGPSGITLPSYSFPSLKHIRLSAYGRRSRDYRSDIGPFRLHNMRTYLSNLTALSLYHLTWQIEETHVSEILALTRNIRSLTLGIDVDYNALLARLYSSHNSGAKALLVPLLEEFTIDCSSLKHESSKTYHHRLPDPHAFTARIVPVFCFHLSDGFISMVEARWDRWEIMRVSQLKKVSLFLEDQHKAELTRVKRGLKWEVEEGLELTLRVIEKPQTWSDPFNKNMTHWHDGLVFQENDSEPSSDCPTCLRLAQEDEEEKGGKRQENEREEDESDSEDEEHYPEPGDGYGHGRCWRCEPRESPEKEDWF
ncbi:hypothetical protein H1R20_g14514, partial [Candolleomyces eurysporus]